MPPSVTSHPFGIAARPLVCPVAVVALEEGHAAPRVTGETEGERGVVAQRERVVPERPCIGE